MIKIVIARLDRLDGLTAEIEAMAIRHTGYGVKESHYTIVGTALLWTLQKKLGKDWTEEFEKPG